MKSISQNTPRSRQKRSTRCLVLEKLECRVVLAADIGLVARSGYELSWFDEFKGEDLDTSQWIAIDESTPTNNSLQDYRPSQIGVANGHLVITSENTSSRGLPYLSGQVKSTALHQHGRIEVRAKLPTSKGMWPAIWLLPDTPNWPSQGEIDIMENRGDQPTRTSSAFHWGTNPPYQHEFTFAEQQTVRNGTLQNYHNSFHDYAVEWDPDQLRFYVDDVHHFTVFDRDTDGFLSSRVGDMRLVINTAIGGDFLDDPDASTQWPQTTEIDHVYTYTKAATPPVLTFENGGFEAQGGSLAGWSTFGNRFNNVSTGHDQLREGTEALKLAGQFTGTENYSGIQQGISVQPGDEVIAAAEAYVSSLDSILDSGNELIMKVDYFRRPYGLFGSADYIRSDSIVLANGASNHDVWMPGVLRSTVPPEAVEARLAFVFIQRADAGGAVYIDDSSFAVVPKGLTLAIVDTSISELDGSTTATVIRSSAVSDSLVVDLAADDASELTVPASIAIPAGQDTSAPFVIEALDDLILDGTQTVTITASAADYVSGTGTIDITDAGGDVAGLLDANGNGESNPFQDGILIIRFMLDQPDANLEDAALIPAGASRSTGAAIQAHLASARHALDANGDGIINAFQDGILIARFLLGQPDANLADPALAPAGSTRTSGDVIGQYLESLMPPTLDGELNALPRETRDARSAPHLRPAPQKKSQSESLYQDSAGEVTIDERPAASLRLGLPASPMPKGGSPANVDAVHTAATTAGDLASPTGEDRQSNALGETIELLSASG